MPSHFAMQFSGSSGACEMNGYEYDASTTFAAPASAVSALPSVRRTNAGFCFASSAAFAA